MRRFAVLAVFLAAGCSDAPPAGFGPGTVTQTATTTTNSGPAKVLFKEPEPEIR
ncbi:MAG TPA: hypothetical protein VKD90_10555 [Gemmataceae bacterium]|nr:hypothetical protein [Gemmataceae bacterium]